MAHRIVWKSVGFPAVDIYERGKRLSGLWTATSWSTSTSQGVLVVTSKKETRTYSVREVFSGREVRATLESIVYTKESSNVEQ